MFVFKMIIVVYLIGKTSMRRAYFGTIRNTFLAIRAHLRDLEAAGGKIERKYLRRAFFSIAIVDYENRKFEARAAPRAKTTPPPRISY
jgi:hypothetical protein